MNIEPLQTGPLGVNTWIVPLAGSAVFIVDPASCALSNDETIIVDYLEDNNLVPIGIVLTHGHFDHISGLPYLRAVYPQIPIAINKNDKDCIGKASRERQAINLERMGSDFEDLLDSVSNLPEADSFLNDGETLDHVFSAEHIISAYSGSERAPDIEAVLNALCHWKVICTPGHSTGSICLYNETEKALISGDTVFYHSYGRTDLYGGDENQIKKSLQLLFKMIPGETRVFPGHESYGFLLESNL